MCFALATINNKNNHHHHDHCRIIHYHRRLLTRCHADADRRTVVFGSFHQDTRLNEANRQLTNWNINISIYLYVYIYCLNETESSQCNKWITIIRAYSEKSSRTKKKVKEKNEKESEGESSIEGNRQTFANGHTQTQVPLHHRVPFLGWHCGGQPDDSIGHQKQKKTS